MINSALQYFQRCQLPDGAIPDASIARFPTANLLKNWDTVNALKAIALWRDRVPYEDGGTIDRVLAFLRSCEKPSGMISWGTFEVSPAEFCTETSSEYISALTHLGLTEQATTKANFLRSRQLPGGAWSEVHPHVPKAFQTVASVTGFAMMALVELGIEPLYLDEALDHLANLQTSAGDFGINWFYYNTHYYLTRPATAALAAYGCYSAVAAVREFTLSQQRADGSWFVRVDGFDATSSPELQSALALQTLVCAGAGSDDPAVRRGLVWLLDRQRADGSWSGGPYPYPDTESYQDFQALQDVYATSQVLALVHQLTR
ncbi:prenyltransferase/squalene oxidase repeat-containing protein [Micromonospora inyonensis]|nr:prenyltransferase/squalene oxidase repeat-containing protein [Micromonospora inyonensis]